jgi:hypothetical protein
MKKFIWVATTMLWLCAAAMLLVMMMFLPTLFDAPGALENHKVQGLRLPSPRRRSCFCSPPSCPGSSGARSLPAGSFCCR